MKTIAMIGAAAALAIGVESWGADLPTPKIPPPEVEVKVDAPAGTSDQEIAAGIAAENARRDPAAQEAARVADEKAARDEAHAHRKSKVCDNIPEDAMEDDPSLRRMCGAGR